MNNIYLFYIFGMYFRYMTCIVLHLVKINFRYRRLLHVQFILCYLYSSLNYYCYHLLAFHSCHVIYSVTRRQFVFTPRDGEWRIHEIHKLQANKQLYKTFTKQSTDNKYFLKWSYLVSQQTR